MWPCDGDSVAVGKWHCDSVLVDTACSVSRRHHRWVAIRNRHKRADVFWSTGVRRRRRDYPLHIYWGLGLLPGSVPFDGGLRPGLGLLFGGRSHFQDLSFSLSVE